MAENDISNGNSFRSKSQAAKPKNKIIKGTAKIKGTRGDKVKGTLFSSGATASSIGQYILQDILVPTLKKLVYDIFTNGLSMSLWGDARGTRNDDRYRYGGSNISYVGYYRDGYYPAESRLDSRYGGVRNGFNYRDVVVDNRGDAELILDRLNEDIEEYGITTVLKLYDYVGLQTYFTDNNYGWSDIRSAEIVREKNGWRIKMPRPEYIKNL